MEKVGVRVLNSIICAPRGFAANKIEVRTAFEPVVRSCANLHLRGQVRNGEKKKFECQVDKSFASIIVCSKFV